MKRYIYSMIFVCLVILSCSKDHSKETGIAEGTHKVVFKVGGFSQQSGGFETRGVTTNRLTTNAADTSLTNRISVLFFAVYDSSGKLVSLTKQLSTVSYFGTYSNNLRAGNYTIAIAGGGKSFSYEAIPYVPGVAADAQSLSTDVLIYRGADININPFSDTFFKKIALTVSSGDVTQNITLNRITSKLDINIQDAIPANTTSITARTDVGVAAWFLVGTETPSSEEEIYLVNNIPANKIGTSNYTISTIVLYKSPVTIDLYAKNSKGETFAEKIIKNVTFEKNKLTVLSGSLFGGSGPNSTNPVIDTAWGGTPILKNF